MKLQNSYKLHYRQTTG